MKKILYLVLLVGFAHSQTGNSFLEDFPHDKPLDSMSSDEIISYNYWQGMLGGLMIGNEETLLLSRDEFGVAITKEQIRSMYIRIRTCNMDYNQRFRIIKKWCDDNPTNTHLRFGQIVFNAFLPLPADYSCFDK